jgi:hypothetical protein
MDENKTQYEDVDIDGSEEVDRDAVNRRAKKLFDTYLHAYHDEMSQLAEQPLTVEDLIATVESATQFLASMAVTVSGVIYIAGIRQTDTTQLEILESLMVDVRDNLERSVDKTFEKGDNFPLGRIIMPGAMEIN